MSFLDYLLDSEYSQRSDINAQRTEMISLSDRQHHDKTELKQQIYQLETENAEIKQVCLALLQTLRDRGLVTDAAFVQQVKAAQSANDDSAWRHVCPEREFSDRTRRYAKQHIDFTDIDRASEEMTQYEDKQ